MRAASRKPTTHVEDLLVEILEQLSRIEARLPADPAAPAARHQQLLTELARVLGDLDLAFDAREVLEHAGLDHGLADALAACGATTPQALGALLRSLRGRDVAGLRLIRDGRTWRLARTWRT